jgi:tRNA uridine 5-carbamoylmethylation protein Kti12
MTPPTSDNVTRIAVIERQLDSMYTVFSRIEQAVEKITETNSSIREMLAVHEQRIQQQETGARNFYEILDRRKEETERGFEKVHRQIEGVVIDLRKQIKEELKEQSIEVKSAVDDLRRAQNQFVSSIEKTQRELNTSVDQKVNKLETSSATGIAALEGRVRKLEAWRWVLVGGGLVIGFVAGNFGSIAAFFGH